MRGVNQVLYLISQTLISTVQQIKSNKKGFHPFIHSGYFYSASSSPLLLGDTPDFSMDAVSEFHAEALQANASEGLVQGPYVVVLDSCSIKKAINILGMTVNCKYILYSQKSKT